jgi:hypothetical protein
VRLLLASEVLPASFGVAVSLKTPKAAWALEALTEEVMEEVAAEALVAITGKLKNKVGRRTHAVLLFFYPIPAGILSFTFVSQVKVGLLEKLHLSMRTRSDCSFERGQAVN